jgi:mono/diheme cytochrome c family protein
MSLSRYRSLSFAAFLLAAACGDGDPLHHMVDAPAELDPGEGEIVQGDDQKIAEEVDPVGLPCNIKAFLAQHCQGCHTAEAKNGTPLLTRDNLVAMSVKDPNAQVGARAVMRMFNMAKPMPPAAKNDRISEADFAMFLGWVQADMPAGSCNE